MHFMVATKTIKRSGFVVYSYFQDSAFAALKMDENL